MQLRKLLDCPDGNLHLVRNLVLNAFRVDLTSR
jgi:hypothetical protein